MFQPYRLLHCILKILRSYHTQDRHHQLFCNKRMFLRSLKGNAADICRRIHTDHGKKCSRISSHTFPVQASASQNYRCERILFFFGCQIAALFCHHIVHQFIHYRRNCYNLFFRNTGQIIIKNTAIYNILRRFSDICRLIHQSRRISCAGADSSLPGREHCRHHSRTTGCGDQGDIFMFHHDIAGLQRRIFHGTGDIIRSASL